jgi:DNA (cytosine-5)-methyltransferase 1
VAWHQLGWEAAGFAEIEPFPAAVLAHHYPAVKNLGDMTNYKEWDLGTIDLLVGGTPCQSFSVAGLRKGLADPRGNLALVYCGILDHFRPKWCVWENVPGVLSSNGGRDFGSFLGALAELGYGFAYRVLDAQYFGVAQRRRRVFVVGYLGDWRPAAEVLFEPESLRGDPAPSREARQEIAGATKTGARPGCEQPYGIVKRLTQRMHKGINTTLDEGQTPVLAPCLETTSHDYSRADGFTMIAQPMAFDGYNQTLSTTSQTIRSDKTDGDHIGMVLQGVAQPAAAFKYTMGAKARGIGYAEKQSPTFDTKPDSIAVMAPTLTAANDPSRSPQSTEVTNQVAAVHAVSMAVRRLTPVECERLQGFPDNYTNIPWRKQPESPDGPRYKALGNSMAVPVMGWIGKRIQMRAGA